MIAKHVPMNSAKASDFAKLVKYITGQQGKSERVGAIRVTNCQSDQAEVASLEVLNTQEQNGRSRADKTYHLLVSFRPGEQPDQALLSAIEDRICAALGFSEHQRISVVHHDTDNLHLHIAINKIHPVRHTIHEPFNAYHTLGQICGKLEGEYGLQGDNHKARKSTAENHAADMEHQAGVESLLSWVKRECTDKIRSAGTWDELHKVMGEHGLRIHERANGLVISADSTLSVKASSVARDFSKANLENRLGKFQPPAPRTLAPPSKRYDKTPMRSKFNTVELYARYKSEQHQVTSMRGADFANAIKKRDRLIEKAKQTGRLRRAVIKLIRAPRIAKKAMYAATSKALVADIAAIHKQFAKERRTAHGMRPRLTWADWLRARATAGDEQALKALRERPISTGLSGNTIGATGMPRHRIFAKPENVTKKGTVIYRVGASAVRDDGNKLKVSRGADQAGLVAALQMAMERYGTCISVNGTDEFKKQVVKAAAAANLSVSFDDGALERQRQQLTQPARKEHKHDNNSWKYPGVRRRLDRSRDERNRQAAASRAANATGNRDASRSKPASAQSGSKKPYAGHIGTQPPPQARNRLREVSPLGMVRVPDRGEVLLQGHVPGHMEHDRAEPDHRVRRNVHGPGRIDRPPLPEPQAGKLHVGRIGKAPPPASMDRLRPLSQLGEIRIGTSVSPPAPTSVPTRAAKPKKSNSGLSANSSSPMTNPAGIAAARKYIVEREQKRAIVFDIPKHGHYTSSEDATMTYMGTRRIDDQPLALLKLGDEIKVLPINEATASRLKRVSVGQQVEVSANGSIKTKGRSR